MKHFIALSALPIVLACTSPSPYYQPCGSGRPCPGAFTCIDVLGAPAFCTIPCERTSACEEQLGAGNHCGLVGYCFHACVANEDCPAGTECIGEVCVIAEDGSP